MGAFLSVCETVKNSLRLLLCNEKGIYCGAEFREMRIVSTNKRLSIVFG